MSAVVVVVSIIVEGVSRPSSILRIVFLGAALSLDVSNVPTVMTGDIWIVFGLVIGCVGWSVVIVMVLGRECNFWR